MANLTNQNKGAIGELLVTARLLQLGHDAANTNFTVKNSKSFDIYCKCYETDKIIPIQVKASVGDSFHTGITHASFYDENGQIDIEKGRRLTEQKILCPWVFVYIPEINEQEQYFILSRTQIIDLIVESEYWYLTGFNRKKELSLNGTVNILKCWLENPGKYSTRHSIKEFINPLSESCKDKWENLWV